MWTDGLNALGAVVRLVQIRGFLGLALCQVASCFQGIQNIVEVLRGEQGIDMIR